MAQSSKTRKQQHTTHSTTNAAHTAHPQQQTENLGDIARKNYEQAMRMGQKLQEEASECWTRLLSQTATAAHWQKRFNGFNRVAADWMPLAQRGTQAAIDMLEKTGRTTAELLTKAVDAAQTPGLVHNQAKWFDFWASSVKAAQANVEAFTELSARTINSWIEFARRNSETTEVQVPKAA